MLSASAIISHGRHVDHLTFLSCCGGVQQTQRLRALERERETRVTDRQRGSCAYYLFQDSN